MFGDNTFTQDMLANPNKLVSAVINEMEASDVTGNTVIQDPNNGFIMQLSATASIFSKLSEKIDYVSSFFHPQRARNSKQLYVHLSEFDYVKLMASPATLPFVFAMSRRWIIENSVYFDSNYDKLEIPKTSYLTMGGVIYSMYHGIDILVNRNTGAVTSFYSTEPDPLNVLESNMLLDVQQYTRDGIEYFQIQFNMYQFERKTSIFTASSDMGFIKTLGYDDQFYACRVFSQNPNGSWIELAYSLESMYYDYQVPTAVLSMMTDSSQIQIEIPQIYFDNRQVSQNIKVELYSTKGNVNYSLSLADVQSVKANFDTQSSSYAAPLDIMPVYNIFPTVLEVVGGSDSMSYNEIREAVVNQRLYDRVAVTTPEIIQAGKKASFDLIRHTDDLTERVYYASNVLTDSKGFAVPTFAGNILLADDALEGNPSTIIKYSDGYYTLLPTTTFSIAENGLTCVPLTDGQVANLSQMTKPQLVAELNKGTYVRQPFHITLLTDTKSPQTLIYNLLSPEMRSLKFIAENPHSAPMMAVSYCGILHLNNGTGGYQILLDVTRSSNIVDSDPTNFSVVLTCLTKVGTTAYLPATYQSTDSNGIDRWMVSLATSYHITTDDHITALMYDVNDNLNLVQIPLNQTFDVITYFNQAFDPSVPVDITLNALLPEALRDNQVAMAQQKILLSLGDNLSSKIYCGVNTTWGNDVYKTASETVYHTTATPIFQHTETGIINTRISDASNNVEVVVLYNQGSTPSSVEDLVLKTTEDVYVSSAGDTTTFKVDDTTGILSGMWTRGLNLPLDAKVVSKTDTTVTVTGKINNTVPKGTLITFTNTQLTKRTTVDQNGLRGRLTIDSTRDMLVGQSVFGFDIPAGVTVKSIDNETQFTLSNQTSASVKEGTLLTILNTTAPGSIKVAKGEVVTDATGKPVVIKGAQNQYLIPAILFDGRLFASDDVSDQRIVTTISQYLQNFANQIATIDAGLIEDSSVFYKPARTMGYSVFEIGGGRVRNLPLELGFSFTVYVDTSVYNSQKLLSTMEESILTITNTAVQEPLISVSDISTRIKDTLGDNVSAVEGGDISGIEGLRLISLKDSNSKPSLENILEIKSDGSIDRVFNVKVTFLPKPDTSEVSVTAYL
jgi:hypothetical protein